MDKDVQALLNHRRLRHIKRCNNFPTVTPINVAAHSFFVAEMAMIIADEVNERKPQVSVEEVMRKALCHDLAEAYTGDIPWNIKHSSPFVHEAITKASNTRLAGAFAGCTEALMNTEDAAKQCKDGLAGAIVNLADMMELGLFCYEEVMAGNTFMYSMLHKCVQLCEGFLSKDLILYESGLVISTLEMLKGFCSPRTTENPLDID